VSLGDGFILPAGRSGGVSKDRVSQSSKDSLPVAVRNKSAFPCALLGLLLGVAR